MKHQVYLGLGANLGNREETILRAYEKIKRLIGTIKRQSAFYYSKPWGFTSENTFANTVILVETELLPRQLLRRTQQIERLMGKTKAHATVRGQLGTSQSSPFTYKDRPIDIDILLYDDLTINEPDLKIPHPLMHERPFVMEPLREIMEPLREITKG